MGLYLVNHGLMGPQMSFLIKQKGIGCKFSALTGQKYQFWQKWAFIVKYGFVGPKWSFLIKVWILCHF